jgi:hypothetical protein
MKGTNMTDESNQEATTSVLGSLQFGGDEHLGFTCTREDGSHLTHTELCSYLYAANVSIHHYDVEEEQLRREAGSLRERVRQLEDATSSLQTRFDAVVQRNEHLIADLRHIGTALHDEAENRQWCDDYDRFVVAVNNRTQGDWLEPCRATVTYDYSMSIEFRGARSELDNIESYVLDQIREVGCDDADHVQVMVRRR